MNLRRTSFLSAITLCVLAFFVSSSIASAAGKVIGHLQEKPLPLNVTVNGQPAVPGAEIHEGDLVETGGNAVVINLDSGQSVQVFANTTGRIYNGPDVLFIATRGGFKRIGGTTGGNDSESLPYLAGFIGNFAGASIGGGGTGAQGPTTTRFNPITGRVEILNALLQVIGFQ